MIACAYISRRWRVCNVVMGWWAQLRNQGLESLFRIAWAGQILFSWYYGLKHLLALFLWSFLTVAPSDEVAFLMSLKRLFCRPIERAEVRLVSVLWGFYEDKRQ